MLSIFQFFATKTDASVLRMLNGSPDERLLKPIAEYITSKGGRIHTRLGCKEVLYEDDAEGKTKVTGLRLARAGKEQIAKADAYIAALDVPGERLRNSMQAYLTTVFCPLLFKIAWHYSYKDFASTMTQKHGKLCRSSRLYQLSCLIDHCVLLVEEEWIAYQPSKGSLHMQCTLLPTTRHRHND